MGTLHQDKELHQHGDSNFIFVAKRGSEAAPKGADPVPLMSKDKRKR